MHKLNPGLCSNGSGFFICGDRMKTFLLIIDIQRGFIDEKTEYVKKRIDELLDHKVFDCVIASVYRNFEGSPISRLMGWKKMTTSKEQAVTGEAVNADRFIHKTTYSAYSEELLEFMKTENGGKAPECVFIAGVDTECCVLMTAASFFEAGVRPVVLSGYCGSSGGTEAHNAGILSMKSIIGENNLFGGKIYSKADIERALRMAEK